MSSILTNNSAMVALETLRGINRGLESIQSEISTGKKIATAKDNAAIWAISTVMTTDVESFKQITDSLNLGSSTVGVARSASEQITDALQDIKSLIVSAQESNVDRTKIQTDIDQLEAQIETIVGAAQFNGLNLIDGSASGDVEVLASLNRNSSGSVSASYINVERQDLSIQNTGQVQTFGGAAVADQTILSIDGGNAGSTSDVAGGGTPANTSDIVIEGVADGNSYRIVLDDSDFANGELNEIGQRTFEYVAGTDDSAESVAANLTAQINNFFGATGVANYEVARSGDTITITNNAASATEDLRVTASSATGGTAGTSTGGLGALATVDVTTDAGASAALTSIETLLQTSIDAAAEFGSSQKRIETQSEFMQTLIDSFTSGIGGLTDSDIEAASAKLQAMQVQQQLGVQALSIANSTPQTLLSLFR
ncbi:MAG: flagellin [Pseudomonadota bacterium]